MQITLFDPPPRRKPNHSDAKAGRDFGMGQAVDHADAIQHDWSDKAYEMLLAYSKSATEFLTEDVRIWSHDSGLPPPPDNRAWGAVINRAVREGLIRRIGYGPSKTGHMRPMPIWKAS